MKQDEILEALHKVIQENKHYTTWTVSTPHLVALVQLAIEKEREACADIADKLPRTYRETKEAHERATLEPFHPSRFGFDFAELRQAEVITHAIRARSNP